MNFFESIKTVFSKFGQFEGRATRPEYWWFALFNFLVVGALGSLNVNSTSGPFGSMGLNSTSNDTLLIGSSLVGFWSFVILLPYLAVTVRRLRDAGYRWVELLWILLPIAGLIILIVRLADPTAPQLSATPYAPATETPAAVPPAAAPPAAAVPPAD
jgi:uncharacterized membrane protein YhaH (DUF805 family)